MKRAIDSALSQTYPNAEVVVADDGSDDATAELCASYGSAVHVVVNRQPLGLAGNWNRSVALARGEHVKFLHQDDVLDPLCVERLVEAIDRSPRVGMSFCRRRVDGDLAGSEGQAWLRDFADPVAGFGERLGTINRGEDLLAAWLSVDPHRNLIGEPVCVLVRRDAMRAVGGFSTRIRQALDADMWLRLMAHGDVAFVDEELATYFHHAKSATAAIRAARADWMDRVWLLEGLTWDPRMSEIRPDIERQRRAEVRMCARIALRHSEPSWPRRTRLRQLASYLAFRARRRCGLAKPPFGSV